MADFLTSMTKRTLGLLPVVQPIIASKFGSESMGAAGSAGLTLLDPFPGLTMEEPSEQWEGIEEQIPPAPRSQSVVPRGVHVPTTSVPGVSPQSAASSQKQPSTTSAQQTALTPARPHAVQPLRETSGGGLSSPMVSQPQALPARNENPRLVSRPPVVNSPPMHKDAPPGAGESLEIVSSQPQTSDQQENQPFSTAPTAPTVPTTKPRRGQGKPFSRSDKLIAGDPLPLVNTQSGEIPTLPPLPDAGERMVFHKNSVEQQRISPSPTSEESSPQASFQVVSYNELSHVGENPYASSYNIESPTLISSSLPVPAYTTGNPPDNRRNITHARRIGTEPVLGAGRGQPGRGQALVPGPVPALPSAASPALRAESDIVEPLLPSAYPSMQTGRMGPSVTRKRVAQQFSESPATPTIRVTIGRIDVRAVTPTPPPAVSPAPVRAQRARPALSLDDYLKQRNGGQQ